MIDQISLEQAIVLLFASTCPSFMFAVLSANIWGFHPKTARLLFWLVFGVALTIAYPVVTAADWVDHWLAVVWLAVVSFMFKIFVVEQ